MRRPENREKIFRENGYENSLNIYIELADPRGKIILPLRKYERTVLPI
jgi:hypothetical protein